MKKFIRTACCLALVVAVFSFWIYQFQDSVKEVRALFQGFEKENSVSLQNNPLQVPTLCQFPTLPTGCEATAAAMLLQFYGEQITADEFAENWILRSRDFYTVDRKLYGPDPHDVFVGDPFSKNSYGCYASVIVNAVNNHSTKCRAKIVHAATVAELCLEYIDQGTPVLIWATMDMREPKKGQTWHLADGSEFTWISGEHCLVLVGYQDTGYYFNDPQTGSTVLYHKELVENRFQQLGSQAVAFDTVP